MLQFDKNQTNNKNALYIDSVNTGSGYYDTLSMVYSQSYDLSNGYVQIFPLSTPNQYRNYLVFDLLGASITAEDLKTGQYDIEIWTAAEATEGRWAFINVPWDNYDNTWETAGDPGRPISYITSDRAYIQGTNQSSVTQYVSSNEQGTYTTYNG